MSMIYSRHDNKAMPLWLRASLTGSFLLLSSLASAEENKQALSLEKSIQMGIEHTPEMKAARAKIGMQQGKVKQSTVWANPNVSIQLDNVLGAEDGSGGYDFTEVAVSQAIPIFHAKKQQHQAALGVSKVEAMYQQQQLQLEYAIAQSFFDVQMKQALLRLNQQHLRAIQQKQKTKSYQRDALIRYLTPLDLMRLDIALQAAKQRLSQSEGLYHEASLSLKALLGLPLEQTLTLPDLEPVTTPYQRNALNVALEQHPSLQMNRQAIAEAEAGIAVAHAQQFADPVVTLFVRREFLAGQRDTVTGLVVSMDAPVWNKNEAGVTQAKYSVQQNQAALATAQRDLKTNVHKSFLHVNHLIEQANHYQKNVLQPAKKMLRLTYQAFDAGELSVLNVIDAYKTSFDTQAAYIQMLASAWQELALLRLNAGISVIGYTDSTPQLEKTQ
ncbi:MAG: TolC family protein [Ghiorsea sp.]|nr:TolC family protein [Ghiorsea sp.]